MQLDKSLMLSNAQAVTVTAKSTDTIDLGPNYAGRRYTKPVVPLIAVINQNFAAAGAGTLTIQVRSSPNSDMSSPVVHNSIGPLALADLQVGDPIDGLYIPENAARYCDVNYVIATGPMTAGQITVAGVTAKQANV